MNKYTSKNAVVWVWSDRFTNIGLCNETPETLQKYFDNGYVIKDVCSNVYDNSSGPVYMFILEKEQHKQNSIKSIKFKTN